MNDFERMLGMNANGKAPPRLAVNGKAKPPNPTNKLYLKFLEFDQKNPNVYKLVCMFADEVLAAGLTRYGISAIWDRIRWHINITTKDVKFKLPNNHRAYYARKWNKDHPRPELFFRENKLRSERGRRDEHGIDEGDPRFSG
jgi:hypothetical protein